ncbi:methyltransferase domain-containing protein [Capilliphycus salinus ALCB114379]|uniref:methyltransferase domain-containing protein n=1 Tax=Capilliphycus salinus TaxID=2768948 RepID=UPI0039A6188A
MKTNRFVENNPIVKTVTQHLAASPQTFQPKIAADDEMYLYQLDESEDRNSDRALVYYYLLGRSIVDSIRQIINAHFGSFSRVNSFLDFACGYGRSTRFLIQEIAPEKVWVSDIYANAVKFQMETFGVNGIVSTREPENYPSDKKFDCIYAGSFFSHMPPRTFSRWMQRLYDLLTPEGLLIFSVLDEEIMPSHVKMLPEGIVFSTESSESQYLDRNEYGTTYVTETYIHKLINKISFNQASSYRIKKGLSNYQDLYVITPKAQQDSTEINFNYHPLGYLDVGEIKPNGNLYLEGWAVDFNPGGQVKTIQMIVNNRLIQQCQPHIKRPDLVEHFQRTEALNSGWSCEINSDEISPEDILLIRAVNYAGLEWIIETDFVKSLIPQTQWQTHLISWRTDLQQTRVQLKQIQVKFNEQEMQFKWTQNQLKQSQAEQVNTEEQLEETQAQLLQREKQLDFVQAKLGEYETKLSQTETELGKCQMQLESNRILLEQAQNRIRAMESSKFWKLRTKWFKLKRAMGLSDND